MDTLLFARNWTSQAKVTPLNPRGIICVKRRSLFESASAEEIKERLRDEVFITQVEITIG
jgi:hypothetical protein